MNRFWDKVVMGYGGECFQWVGAKDRCGYGRMAKQGINGLAHRVAWELVNGQIPEGEHVLHRCDNPGCVRPEHLFLGTHADNMKDCAVKGRARAKLKANDIMSIRLLSAEGIPQKAIARIYGMSKPVISSIVHKLAWKHVPVILACLLCSSCVAPSMTIYGRGVKTDGNGNKSAVAVKEAQIYGDLVGNTVVQGSVVTVTASGGYY